MSAPESLPLRQLPDHVRELLSSPVVTALDAYFRARYRAAIAVMRLDEAGIAAALIEEREHLAQYLALVIERLDSRAASMLVDVLTRVENLEALMRIEPAPADDVDDPTGFDAGRRP
jgi:hypothetical protein